MRRGLLAWSEEEVPRTVLEARVARTQQAMREAGLHALLLYTSFPRPAGVSFLTHFVPYWSQGVLLVPPQGMPGLYVNLSKRVAGWMQETAHVEQVVSTPRLGPALAHALAAIRPGDARLGVVELAKFPASALAPLVAAHGSVVCCDATTLFAAIRHPADDTELALSLRAALIARDALAAAITTRPARTRELAAAVEYAGRTGGAEEIVTDIAADLGTDAHMRRFEGDEALGARYAVRASVAYKGHWIRLGRTVERDAGRALDLDRAVSAVVAGLLGSGSATAGHRVGPDELTLTMEACIGSSPLSVVGQPPSGAVVSLTMTGRDDGGAWIVSEPVAIGREQGARAARLLEPV